MVHGAGFTVGFLANLVPFTFHRFTDYLVGRDEPLPPLLPLPLELPPLDELPLEDELPPPPLDDPPPLEPEPTDELPPDEGLETLLDEPLEPDEPEPLELGLLNSLLDRDDGVFTG